MDVKEKYCRTSQDSLSSCLMLPIIHFRIFFYSCYEDQKLLDIILNLDLAQCLDFMQYKFKIKTLKYI